MAKYEYDIDTREEAETERNKRLTLPAQGRCPLFGLGQCMKQCVCYVLPYIQECNGKFRVGDGYCGNGMFQDRPELQM